jgi:hypothetical protein
LARNINERIGSDIEFYRSLGDNVKNTIRVAIPGIVQTFNSIEQTVTVQPAIREQIIKEDLSKEWVDLPLLLDVPIVIPRAGGYSMTLPVSPGDECLVIFLDLCIDAWWSYGGVQNQLDKRRHDLSDGVAILGLWSQPNVIANYSTDSCQLRNDNGETYIELRDNDINLVADSVKINGVDFNKHTHNSPVGGGETSEPS